MVRNVYQALPSGEHNGKCFKKDTWLKLLKHPNNLETWPLENEIGKHVNNAT